MTDWMDELSPEQRGEWDAFVEHTRRDTLQKMAASAFVMSFVPEGDVDVKFALELGMAIMLDKPVLAVVGPGAAVPPRLRRVADAVVEVDIDTEEGRRALAGAIERFQERLP